MNFEDITSFCGENNAFVIFHQHKKYALHYSPDKALEFANDTFSGFVFAPFNANSIWPSLYLQPQLNFETKEANELLAFLSPLKPTVHSLPVFDATNIKKEDYLKMVDTSIQSLDNSFPKVVLSRIKSIEKRNVWNYYLQLCEKFPNNGTYIFYSPQSGLWVGSSPEILLKTEEEKAYTCALAGTQNIQTDWSKKEKEEQGFVKNYITEIIERHGHLTNSKDIEIQLNQIKHLKTNYYFNFNGKLGDIVRDLHPTPAVAGIPKQKAIDFISDKEPHDRMYYTGYFGRISQNQSQLFVNLRCLRVDDHHFHYYLGGGITKDSISEKEFQETENKFRSITQL